MINENETPVVTLGACRGGPTIPLSEAGGARAEQCIVCGMIVDAGRAESVTFGFRARCLGQTPTAQQVKDLTLALWDAADFEEGAAHMRKFTAAIQQTAPIATGWAVVGPHGLIGAPYFSAHMACEATAWWYAGFRTRGEIAEAKACGARAFRCELREIEG